ncbi:hypothetical protein B0J14DRAFT_586569 [Halenospora varia]|nr:hypothetical protein B0J14DRAFT_586569 [Halenospora varia]
MAPPVTECATITLKPGVEIEGSTPEAQIWKETLMTVSQQPGYQRAHYGRQLENSTQVILLIDWDTLKSHQDFIDNPIYGPFTDKLAPLMEGITMHHIVSNPFPPTLAGKAPVIECCTVFDVKSTFLEDNLAKFTNALDTSNVQGYLGNVTGEIVEELEWKGKKGNAVKLLIGWTSKDEHMKFRDSQVFKDNIGLLREGNGGIEMFHVPFKAF